MQGLEHYSDNVTRAMVAARVARGCGYESIAAYLEITPETLRKHYAVELRVAKELCIDKVFSALMNRIEAGSDSAIQYYLSRQGGWRSADNDVMADAVRSAADAADRRAAIEEEYKKVIAAQNKAADVTSESSPEVK